MYIFVSLQKDSTLLGLLFCIFYIKHRSFILNPPPKNYHVREKNLHLPEKLPIKSTSGGIFPHQKFLADLSLKTAISKMIFKSEIHMGLILLILPLGYKLPQDSLKQKWFLNWRST